MNSRRESLPSQAGGSLAAESIVVDGTRINYWRGTTEHAETVLLLHGLGGDHRGLVEVAAGLRGVNVLIPDLPGYGDSAPLSRPHGLANYAAAVEALRVGLGLGPVHLLGHSLGASIALLHASTFPAALRSLCLVNPVSTANNLTANLGKIYYRIAAALPAPLARFWLASKPAVWIADAMIIVSRDKRVRRRILVEDYENYARASIPAMIESFLSYYDTRFEDCAARVAVDSLLVTGDADSIAPPKSVTALGAAMSRARVRVLPGGGHLLPLEQPADVVEVVNEFLADRAKGGVGKSHG
ncbi:MAG TPA: alpha/beta hydrolase [Pseudonocardiaceae bacterium]|jgi:pimeloyl-ACP methyl ester carboxylesterase|nr:alpha/beta hydrolase [Pseudonocardiaceae bacterium]